MLNVCAMDGGRAGAQWHVKQTTIATTELRQFEGGVVLQEQDQCGFNQMLKRLTTVLRSGGGACITKILKGVGQADEGVEDGFVFSECGILLPDRLEDWQGNVREASQ